MDKKVVDIFSPKKREISKNEIFTPKETVSEEKIVEVPKIKQIKISFKFIFILSVLILGFGFYLLSYKFSKVQVKIWPQFEQLVFEEKVIADTKVEKISLKEKIIPAKIIEVEEEFSSEFLATGKILKKSQGTIRLFNEYTTQEETWLAGTRFVSSEGKLFKSKEKILVPGATTENGKLKATFVDVPVEAAEGGADYNIGPSEFSILAFKGTPRYFKYYGKSLEPMRGGGEFPQVKKEDLENAEKSLIETAKSKAIAVLKNKIPQDFLIPEEAISVVILEKNSSAKEGEQIEKFSFRAKAKIKAIAFSEKELLNFSKEYIQEKISPQKEIYLPELKLDFKTELVNFDLGKTSLSLKIFSKSYETVDQTILKKALAEKSLSEAKAFLVNQPQFSKTKIEIFPYWIKKIPENINKIEIIYPLVD